jgi:hypothetical protein
VPESILDIHTGPASPLLFGSEASPPLWLWLALEPEEVDRLEAALLDHLRSPLFPARIGERPMRRGDDVGLLAFVAGFAPLAPRFAGGPDLVLAATRIVAERGGPLCREAALACIEALQHRLHAEARSLSDPGASPHRLRRFVLSARLSADLWLRFLPGPESGRPIAGRIAEVVGLPPFSREPSASAATAIAAQSSTTTEDSDAGGLAATIPSRLHEVVVLQPFEPPNDRPEWQNYQPLATPMPLRTVPRDAAARLHGLAEVTPAFARPLAEIRRGLALSSHAGRPSPRIRPILLVGPPGVGKTWFARRVAQALDLPFSSLNLGGATDNRCLQGTARGWSAATPAWPIAELARLGAPNPVLFLDEVEKAGGQRESNGRVHDTLLAMIEPESAASWFDECLRTNADLRHIVWIMAANETRGIPAPLLSRVSVHEIAPPPASAFPSVIAGLRTGVAEDMGCRPDDLPPLEPATEEALRRSFARHRNLRRLRAQLEECLGLAAEAALLAAH